MVTIERGEYKRVRWESCVHAVVAQFLQGGVPQDSDMPLTRMSAIVQLNNVGSPKLHVLINTKIKLLNKLNLANIMKWIWQYVNQEQKTCNFGDSYCGVAEGLCLLRCDAVLLG